MSRSVSVTTAGQCRLAPLIQVILDCSHLYDYTVKLLFKLHSCEYTRLGPLCELQARKGSPAWSVPGESSSRRAGQGGSFDVPGKHLARHGGVHLGPPSSSGFTTSLSIHVLWSRNHTVGNRSGLDPQEQSHGFQSIHQHSFFVHTEFCTEIENIKVNCSRKWRAYLATDPGILSDYML